MSAAFVAFTAAERAGLPPPAAALVGLAASMAIAYLVYTIGLRPLGNADHLYKGVATLAMDIILVNVARLVWGPSPFRVESVLQGRTLQIGGLHLPLSYIATFAVAMGAAFILHLFLTYSRVGIAVRAVTQNPAAAELMGVNLARVSALSWALCGLLAGIAGLLLAPIVYLSFQMMNPYLVRMFAAAALGGLNSVWGAVVGGLSLGVVEGLVGRVVPATIIDVVSVLILLLVLIFRPQGLFGTITIRRV
jgi:branched-chain amino acid transport system permease protein